MILIHIILLPVVVDFATVTQYLHRIYTNMVWRGEQTTVELAHNTLERLWQTNHLKIIELNGIYLLGFCFDAPFFSSIRCPLRAIRR